MLTIPTSFTAVDKFTAPLAGMSAASESFATKTESSVLRADRVVNKFAGGLNKAQNDLLSLAGKVAVAAGIMESADYGYESLKKFETTITGIQSSFHLTDKATGTLRNTITGVADDTHKGAVEIAQSFNIIASKNQELINTPKLLGEISKSGVTLSEAFQSDLIPTTTALVGVMSTFQIPLTRSADTINVLAAASAGGAVQGIALTDAIASIGAEARAHNMTLAQTAATIEIFDKVTNSGAEGATSLAKTIFKVSKEYGGWKDGAFSMIDALDSLKGRYDRMTNARQREDFLMRIFGSRQIAQGRALLDSSAAIQQYTANIQNTNAAHEQAEKNAQTFAVTMDRVKNAFSTSVIESDKAGTGLNTFKNILVFVYQHMNTLLDVAGLLIAAFIIWKTVVLGATIYTGLFNVAMGITGAVTGVANVAIGQSSIALLAYNVASAIGTAAIWAMTGAQWALNVALDANPMGLIIIGIAALIALVVEVIQHWNEWGAALTLFLGPLGFVISLVQSFRRNWDMVVDAFHNGGILSGITAIGKVLLDAVLMPVQQLLTLIGKVTGAEWATNAAANLDKYRAGLGLNVTTDENGKTVDKPFNTANERHEAVMNRMETTDTKRSEVTIRALPGTEIVTQSNGGGTVMPSVGSTNGGFFSLIP